MRKKDLIKKIDYITKQNMALRRDNRRLRKLCEVKDAYFLEAISDGLRNGSKVAAKHMADRRAYLNGR